MFASWFVHTYFNARRPRHRTDAGLAYSTLLACALLDRRANHAVEVAPIALIPTRSKRPFISCTRIRWCARALFAATTRKSGVATSAGAITPLTPIGAPTDTLCTQPTLAAASAKHCRHRPAALHPTFAPPPLCVVRAQPAPRSTFHMAQHNGHWCRGVSSLVQPKIHLCFFSPCNLLDTFRSCNTLISWVCHREAQNIFPRHFANSPRLRLDSHVSFSSLLHTTPFPPRSHHSLSMHSAAKFIELRSAHGFAAGMEKN